MGYLQNYGGGGGGGGLNLINQIGGIENETSQIAQNNTLTQAIYNRNSTALNANGLEAQLQIKQITEQQSINSDIEAAILRGQQELQGKQLEISNLVAQYREKTLNLIIQIQEARISNTWNRLKSVAAGFKY